MSDEMTRGKRLLSGDRGEVTGDLKSVHPVCEPRFQPEIPRYEAEVPTTSWLLDWSEDRKPYGIQRCLYRGDAVYTRLV